MNRTLALALILSLAAASRAQFAYAGSGVLYGISADGRSYQFDPDPLNEGTVYARVATHAAYDSDPVGYADGLSSSGTAIRVTALGRYQLRYADGSALTVADALGRPATYALIDGTRGDALARNHDGLFRFDSSTMQATPLDMGGIGVLDFSSPSADGSFGFTTTGNRAGAYAGGSAFLLNQENYAYSVVDGGVNPTGPLSYAFGHVGDGMGHYWIASWKIDPLARTSVLTTYQGLDAIAFDISNPIRSGWAYGFSNGGRVWFDLDTGSVIPDTDTLPSGGLSDVVRPFLTDSVLGLSLTDGQSSFGVYLNGHVPDAVPEPATLAVLGLGAFATFRRKRS